MGLRVHDLCRLSSPAVLEAVDPPSWVAAALYAAPWVVVRRGFALPGRVAVGVRGFARPERFAAFIAEDAIAERLAPEDLLPRAVRPPRPHLAFEALAALGPAFGRLGAPWGPAGAAGFELAAGRSALTEASDLDVVVRTERLPERKALESIAGVIARATIRVDVLIETSDGGIALADAIGDDDHVLLRTPEGPRLVHRAALSERVRC